MDIKPVYFTESQFKSLFYTEELELYTKVMNKELYYHCNLAYYYQSSILNNNNNNKEYSSTSAKASPNNSNPLISVHNTNVNNSNHDNNNNSNSSNNNNADTSNESDSSNNLNVFYGANSTKELKKEEIPYVSIYSLLPDVCCTFLALCNY
jgi:hypothetical protein